MTPGTEKVREWATSLHDYRKMRLDLLAFCREWNRKPLRIGNHFTPCLAYGAYLRHASEMSDKRHSQKPGKLDIEDQCLRQTYRKLNVGKYIAVWKETLVK